ncbi:non-specific serine/threonine protein kinase [Saccharopolyspora erythraea NRRL 2338]|uniref:LuxR family transcriptional regulator n=1 Tax=Saccharopolyspora erythraea TaxID=1836 RepID=A0ABP3NBP0_SACER|nr:non-specific serine/threonine protein kinase [Saccharopolyspora erythraea NRRL 2338]
MRCVVTQVALPDVTGLPHELTSFVGRREATTGLRRALADSRLVTLTGFGGIGKSRLALHVAHELRRAFPDGAHLVELADVHDPSLVPHAVAAAIGLHDRSARDLETVLVDYLAGRNLLLVLDNCEHLLDACGRLTAVLLTAAPRLRVLATSREPLRIAPEQVWPVPPLRVPAEDGPGMAKDQEAMRLFEDRAAAVLPEFSLDEDNERAVARLCRRLDGVPLAIELAAVRVRMLSVADILDRLESRFDLLSSGPRTVAPRHRSLRAAVDWSFDLCTEQEQRLWARCSVFAGEFDLDAAEDVCAGDGLTTQDVFTGIAGLIDKSILARVGSHAQSRYRMPETIRQYGRERLAEAGGEAALLGRHRDHCLHVAEQSDAESTGPHQAGWIKRLNVERANFWAALEHCATTPGEARTGLRMTTALWFYWVACGCVREGRNWLDRVLALDAEPNAERARALWINGWVAHLHGDRDASLALLEESRCLAGRLGAETGLSHAIQFLGDTQMWDGNLAAAGPLLDDALRRHRASRRWTAPGLITFALQASTAGLRGDVDRAMAFLRECRAVCEPLGERWALSWTEWNTGVVWWAAGEPDEAAEHVSSALRKKQQLNDLVGIACCVEVLTWVAAAKGDARRAAVLFGALGKRWDLIGSPLFGSETLCSWREPAKARVREQLRGAVFDSARQEGERMDQERTVAYALGETSAARAPARAGTASEGELALTRREREVAALVAEGKSNKEIAADLVISQRTAEAHVEHILVKLGFTSRLQIATWVAQREQR